MTTLLSTATSNYKDADQSHLTPTLKPGLNPARAECSPDPPLLPCEIAKEDDDAELQVQDETCAWDPSLPLPGPQLRQYNGGSLTGMVSPMVPSLVLHQNDDSTAPFSNDRSYSPPPLQDHQSQ